MTSPNDRPVDLTWVEQLAALGEELGGVEIPEVPDTPATFATFD